MNAIELGNLGLIALGHIMQLGGTMCGLKGGADIGFVGIGWMTVCDAIR